MGLQGVVACLASRIISRVQCPDPPPICRERGFESPRLALSAGRRLEVQDTGSNMFPDRFRTVSGLIWRPWPNGLGVGP